jgi:dihydrofolate reductase
LGGRYPDGTRRISIFSILLAAAINIIAPKMNNLPKIVFSKTLEKVEWNKSRLIKDNIADEVSKIKQQPGKDLVLFTGADIASTFIQPDLIDEYQIIVNPVILGGGKPSF